MGRRGAGPEELRAHQFFHGFSWGELQNSGLESPHRGTCDEAIASALKAGKASALTEDPPKYTEDPPWFDGYASFISKK